MKTLPLAAEFAAYCTAAYMGKQMPDGVNPLAFCVKNGDIRYSTQATLDAYTFFELGWNAALGKPKQVLEQET
jgi:hypothetical protein